ncbi:MAG TPA: alpha/beta fold hydrolase [Solirubrobacteraceae bacterium]|nr:alpha/beta fold hydrolase [Solirubrobacteraceae bacterium]
MESAGEGPAVLLIMGLGMNATGWWRTVPTLVDAGLRVIAFDNRGVGRSDRPPGPYTVAQMADDAVSVLDSAGVDAAHVYGISLGGMIAQEVALRHPDRVRALVLGATTAGGDNLIPASEDVNAFVRLRAQMTAEHAVWASVPINYARRTRLEAGDRIAEDIAQRLRFPVEAEYYSAQLAAAHGHDAAVADIRAPTLVVHGDEDVLIPPANGERLAELIPGAELSMWSAAHLYFTDEPEADRYVARWLSERSSPGPSTAPSP